MADQPGAIAEAAARMPLTEVLKLVPRGALTEDLFGVGKAPGWFFDKWYAAGAGFRDGGENNGDVGKGSDSDESSRPCVALRSAFEFALPLGGYDGVDDRRGEQDAAYRRFARQFTDVFAPGGNVAREAAAVGVRVLHAGGGISEDEAAALVLGDLRFAAAAFALVFACVLAYTRSPWTTFNATLGIALSFPTGFFFFRVATASPFVSFLNMLVPFVLLGIGCDDAMIVFDALSAAERRGSGEGGGQTVNPKTLDPGPGGGVEEGAFVEAYASAARAMLATSLTTAVAFGSNVFSFIPPVRALGTYAAITVVSNYALVLTLLPAALVMRSRGAGRVFGDALREGGATAGMTRLAGRARDAFEWSLGARRKHAYAPLEDPGGGRGEVEVRRATEVELQDMTARPIGEKEEEEEEEEEKKKKKGGVGKSKKENENVGGGGRTDEEGWTGVGVEGSTSTRGNLTLLGRVREASEGCDAWLVYASDAASDAFGAFVVRRRFAIIAVCAIAIAAAAVVVARGLRVARVPPPLLKPDTNLQRIQHLLFDVFYTENWSNVKVVFGVAGVDTSASDPNDPTSVGSPLWDPAFDFEDARTQRALLTACDVVLRSRDALNFTPEAGDRECALQAFVRDSGGVDGVEWGAALPMALARWSRGPGRNWRENLGWAGEEGRSRLRFLTADYYVDVHPAASSTEEIRKVYAAWEAVVSDARRAMSDVMTRTDASAPAGNGSQTDDGTYPPPGHEPPPAVFQACDVWNRMGVEESVRYTARVSPGVSAAAAAVITLVSTRSVRVTVAALVTIAAGLILMLGALVRLGWTFGVVEELCVTLLIGSSVDYCIHLAVAYSEAAVAPSWSADLSRDAARAERTRAALRTMAPTLTGAALTTAASSAMLLACRVEVLTKIGATVVANTVVGYVLALALFSSLMATFGD